MRVFTTCASRSRSTGGLSHLGEPLYAVPADRPAGRPGSLFAYLDPRNRAVQKEMEQVFTDYLQKIGAYVPAGRLRRYDATGTSFPVEASVVIPVRNRAKTVAQAVRERSFAGDRFPLQRDRRR